MIDPLESLRKRFPGRKIDVQSNIGLDDFVPTRRINVDGRRCRARWSVEAEQDLASYHNIDIGEEITKALAEELMKDMPPLGPWQKFKNAVNYKRERTKL